MENEPIIKNLSEEILPKKSKYKKIILIAVALLVIICAASYFLPNKFNILSILNLSNSSLVAVVDGEKITKNELSDRVDKNKEVFKQQGLDLSDEKVLAKINKQTLDEMINEKVLLQNAKKEGITASDNEVSVAYDNLVSKFKSKDDFDKELSALKFTEKSLKENIGKQIVLKKYVEKNTDIKNITATKEEIKNLYNNYKANQKDMPNLSEIEKQLENEVKQQKIRVMVEAFIEKIKKETEIKIF